VDIQAIEDTLRAERFHHRWMTKEMYAEYFDMLREDIA